jgi:hypothetical protein
MVMVPFHTRCLDLAAQDIPSAGIAPATIKVSGGLRPDENALLDCR